MKPEYVRIAEEMLGESVPEKLRERLDYVQRLVKNCSFPCYDVHGNRMLGALRSRQVIASIIASYEKIGF